MQVTAMHNRPAAHARLTVTGDLSRRPSSATSKIALERLGPVDLPTNLPAAIASFQLEGPA